MALRLSSVTAQFGSYDSFLLSREPPVLAAVDVNYFSFFSLAC